MVALRALAVSLILGLAAADECPALSNTFGFKPKNLWTLKTVDCRVSIQAAECATNVRGSTGQTWAAFRINHNHDCNHGAPYGDCCVFNTKPPKGKAALEANPSVWLFYWDSEITGLNKGFGTNCIQDPTTGCCGRQDEGHVLTSGGCPYPPSNVKDAEGNLVSDMFGRVGDGCTEKPDPKDNPVNPEPDPTDPPGTDPKDPKNPPTNPKDPKNPPTNPKDPKNPPNDPKDPKNPPGNHPKPPPKGKKKPGKGRLDGDDPSSSTTIPQTSPLPHSQKGTGEGGLRGTNDEVAEHQRDQQENSVVQRLGRRLASFRLARRQDELASAEVAKGQGKDRGDGNADDGKGKGTGNKNNSGYRRVVSGAGPGGFPKCGPYGNFGPEITCKKDIKAMCKPKVKNQGTGGNHGHYDDHGPGDTDGTNCPKKKSDLEQAADQTTAKSKIRKLRRWAAMDTESDLLKRSPDGDPYKTGGNQFDHNNAGQLKPGGPCCWCVPPRHK